MKRAGLIIIPLVIVIILAGVSIYAYFVLMGKDYSEVIYMEGKHDFVKGDFRESYYHFNEIVIKYPKSKYFNDANSFLKEAKKQADIYRLYEIGLMNFKNNNFRRAQKFFSYVKNYPDFKYIKDAQKKEELSSNYKTIQDDFEDAELALKDKDYTSAIHKFQKIIDDYPSNVYLMEARRDLKFCREELSKITGKQAEEWAKQRAEKNIQIAEELFKKANDFLAQDEYYKALLNYQKIINSYPLSSHLVEAKERAIRVMIIVNDIESKRLFFEAKKFFESGKIRNAMEKYGMIVKIYSNTEIYFRAKEELAITQSIFGKKIFEEAKQFLDKGDKKEGVDLLKGLIEKYPSTQWAEQAKFQIYLLQSSGIARDLLNEASDFYRQTNYVKAAETFEKIIRNYPDDLQLLESAKSGLVKSTAAQSFIIAEKLYSDQVQEKEAIDKYKAIVRDFASTEWAEKSINKIRDYDERNAKEIFDVADGNFKAQKYEQAMQSYNEIIAKYPLTSFANKSKEFIENSKNKIFEIKFNQIEDAYIAKEHYDEAIIALKFLIKEVPTIEWKIKIEKNIAKSEDGIIQKMFRAARELYNQEKYQEAQQYYRVIIEKYSKNFNYVDEAKKNISLINSELFYKKIVENLEKGQYAIVTRAFNQLKEEKFPNDWISKSKEAIKPHLQNIYDKALEFLTKEYYDYSLEMFKLITDNYPESDLIPKAKQGVFKVNLNKPATSFQPTIK